MLSKKGKTEFKRSGVFTVPERNWIASPEWRKGRFYQEYRRSFRSTLAETMIMFMGKLPQPNPGRR